LVLLEGGSEVGVPGPSLDYTDADIQKLFARYNGQGDAAQQYGTELLGVYHIFEKYNALIR
jgi:hypothetical protein